MKGSRLVMAGLTLLATAIALPTTAHAQSFDFSFSGSGVSGMLTLTYGAATDTKYPNAYEITGISGRFSDRNNGLNIVNVAVGPLLPITRDMPDSTNLLAPNDFSRWAVATGLSPISGGFATYDNLFWPDGSPQTATDYPPSGGFLDIYGLMFEIGGGRVVNFWSNGADANGVADYGASVTTSHEALDYVGGGVAATATPEPGSLALLGTGLVGVVGVIARRRRRAVAA